MLHDVKSMACHSLTRLVTAGVLADAQVALRVFMSELSKTNEEHGRYTAALAAEIVHRIDHVAKGVGTACPALIRKCRYGDGWDPRAGPGS